MSVNMERKKSQRWVSVSKGTYDGKEWDSSEEDEPYGAWENDEGQSRKSPERNGTVSKLPPLPMLSYGKDSRRSNEAERTETGADEASGSQQDSTSTGAGSPRLYQSGSGAARVNSQSSTGRITRGPSQYKSENLDHLMTQLSQELTPVSISESRFSFNDDGLKSPRGSTDRYRDSNGFSYSESEEEPQVSKTGYFSNMMQSPDGANQSSEHSESEFFATPDPSNVPQATFGVTTQAERDAGDTVSEDSRSETPKIQGEQLQRKLISPRASDYDLPQSRRSSIDSDKQTISAQEELAPVTALSTDDNTKETKSAVLSDSSAESQEILNSQETTNSQETPNSQETLNSQETPSSQDSPSKNSAESTSQEQSLPNALEASRERSSIQEERDQVINDPSESQRTPNAKTFPRVASSSDEYEDNESFFNQYGNNSSQSSPANRADRGEMSSPPKLRQTTETKLSQGDGDGSQSDQTETDGTASNSEVFKFKDRIRDSILESSDDDIDDDESVLRVPKSGYYAQMVKETSGPDESDDQQTVTDDDYTSSSGTDVCSITKSINYSSARPRSSIPPVSQSSTEKQGEAPAESPSSDDDQNKVGLNSRQSVNLGKWQPDTDAGRAEFLGQAKPEVPEGYVVDQDGQLVNVNPSSMRDARVVSTYSEAESAWNAFPASAGNGGDLDTIYDTKTIYDNQTIHNVPGLATNNDSLPPLPRDITAVDSSLSANVTDSDSILNHLNGVKRHHYSNLKESFSVHTPDQEEIALVKQKAVPTADLDALITRKNTTHAAKINDLNKHFNELKDYDSGLHTWISYALKTSTSDKDYIFQNYKVSTHVKDAYSHADDLSKKMTVSNTVANVNQNVSHLKRKVFSHTMKEKSKGLFSSISKKKT